MQRSYLLTVSQLRIQASIELLLKKTLVAAKIWVSRYPVSLIIIHTNASSSWLRHPTPPSAARLKQALCGTPINERSLYSYTKIILQI